MEVYNHDLVILGSGLAGLRAALEASMQSKGELNIALVSKRPLLGSSLRARKSYSPVPGS